MTYIYQDQVKDKSKTALILCVYRRLENFSKTLGMIKGQSNKDFDFYICDNSDNTNKVIGLINKYFVDSNINIYVRKYSNEFKIFSRFFLSNELAKDNYDKIIFIDDDEKFSNNFVQDCYDQYEEDAVKTFWAHKIENIYDNKVKLVGDEVGNYAGGGGLVCSSKVFLSEELMACPEEYWILDDLWLSYYLLRFTDYKIKSLDTDIRFIHDEKATFLTLKSLKQEFAEKFIIPLSDNVPKIVRV